MVWTLPQYLAWSICNVTITNRSTWKSGNGILPNSGNDQALESLNTRTKYHLVNILFFLVSDIILWVTEFSVTLKLGGLDELHPKP